MISLIQQPKKPLNLQRKQAGERVVRIMGMDNKSELTLYISEDGEVDFVARVDEDDVWLSVKAMAKLYDLKPAAIEKELSAILEDDPELKNRVRQEQLGSKTEIYYPLDTILEVGYAVKSARGRQFRKWATQRLNDYLTKGYAINERLLMYRTDYFDLLLTHTRKMRASERILYSQIRDILASSSDYTADEKETQQFFATVQNKFHFAATGMTAAEIVYNRADGKKRNMGMTNWQKKALTTKDARNAKNYLSVSELEIYVLAANTFLDYAKFRIGLKQTLTMASWLKGLDAFLELSGAPVLEDKGSISMETAKNKAKLELATYRARMKYSGELPDEYAGDVD